MLLNTAVPAHLDATTKEVIDSIESDIFFGVYDTLWKYQKNNGISQTLP